MNRVGGMTMLFSEFSDKELIDAIRAERMGKIGHTDLEINEQTGEIIAFILPNTKWGFFRSLKTETRIPWESIEKIGPDMVLICGKNE